MIKNAFDPENFRATGHELIDTLADYLTQLQQDSSKILVSKTQSPEEQLDKWQNFETNQEWGNYFKEYLDDSMHLHHPK